MAGIKISENRDWIVAKWLYEFLMQKVPTLGSLKGRTLERLDQGRTDGTNLALLADLTVSERKSFYDAVVKVYAEVRTSGPSGFATPDVFPGVVKHLEILIALMEEEWSDVSG